MFTCSFILANTPLPFCLEASVEGKVKGRRARALQLSSPAACSRLSKERTAAAGSPLTPHLAVFPQSKFFSWVYLLFWCEVLDKFNQTVKYLPTAGISLEPCKWCTRLPPQGAWKIRSSSCSEETGGRGCWRKKTAEMARILVVSRWEKSAALSEHISSRTTSSEARAEVMATVTVVLPFFSKKTGSFNQHNKNVL